MFGALRPAYGHRKDGHADLKQVLLSLGVSGDGGLPLRLGLRDGDQNNSTETPVAIEECLALGLDGVRGIAADSKAYSRRTLGLFLERPIGLVTLVPRTCAVRQALEAWRQQQPTLPLLVEKLGRTKAEGPRQWHGQSVMQAVEVEYSDGRVAREALRFVVVHSSQLAQQQTQTYAAAHAKEADAIATHIKRVEARQFACLADAEAAIVDYAGRAPSRRGRPPRLWRYHAIHSRVLTETRPTRRARGGRPAKTDPPLIETGYRLVVEVEDLPNIEAENGWIVLAWLGECALEHDKSTLVLQLACDKLRRAHIVRLGLMRLERLVATARPQVYDKTWRRLTPFVTSRAAPLARRPPPA